MSTLTATTSLHYETGGAYNAFFYLVQIDFPGTYENDTVHSELTTNPAGPNPYPVSIQFHTDTGKLSSSGTTRMVVEYYLDNLPWGTDPQSANPATSDHISIEVDIRDQTSNAISGGGIVHQAQASGVVRPGNKNPLAYRDSGRVHQVWASGQRKVILPPDMAASA